jgi:DNA-binding response OmpR family regulator
MSIKLEQRIAELEEELAYYRNIHAPPPKVLSGHLRKLGFMPREIKVMELFTKRKGVSSEAISLTLGDASSPTYPSVIICTLRKKLEPHDITLKTIRSYGWTINEESQKRLQALVTPTASPAPDPLRAAFNRAKLRGLT